MQLFLSNWPYLLSGVVALALVAGIITLLVIYHTSIISTIAKSVKGVKQGIFNRETLFWTVNLTFMAFSAYHAAPFYASVSTNILGMDWFAPFVGITAALVLDALVIVFQNARKRAGYKHDRKRAHMYMWYIAACCGLNSIANVYTNYQHFDAANYANFWGWAINIAPIFLSLFPLFIMGMSNALEEMSSSKALDTLDVEAFKKDEEKRVGLVEAQAEYQEREVRADRRLIELERMRKENDRLRKGKPIKVKRVSRLGAWFWQVPLQDDYVKALEIVTRKHQETVTALQTKYDTQIVTLTEQIASLTASLSVNNSRRQSVTKNVANSDAKTSQTVTQLSTQERHTDELNVVGKSDDESDVLTPQKPTPIFGKRGEKAALRKVRNIVKRYPEMGPTEIAKRAQISRSYASQLLKELQTATI